jgi:hypothetical protein
MQRAWCLNVQYLLNNSDMVLRTAFRRFSYAEPREAPCAAATNTVSMKTDPMRFRVAESFVCASYVNLRFTSFLRLQLAPDREFGRRSSGEVAM